jgi:hypothetical protein
MKAAKELVIKRYNRVCSSKIPEAEDNKTRHE